MLFETNAVLLVLKALVSLRSLTYSLSYNQVSTTYEGLKLEGKKLIYNFFVLPHHSTNTNYFPYGGQFPLFERGQGESPFIL